MLKTVILSLACLCLSACAHNLTPEQQALKLQRAQLLMQASAQMQQTGMSLMTPAINRYYYPPGTVVVPPGYYR